MFNTFLSMVILATSDDYKKKPKDFNFIKNVFVYCIVLSY